MIEYFNENDINQTDSRELMELLQLCFPTLPQFRTSRYWLEPCDYRWLIRIQDKIVVNASVIEKTFLSGSKKISIAGVAYVCTHPEYRSKGLVKQVLTEIHRWAKNQHYSFAFLFGKNEIYRSSGYIQCNNEFKFYNHNKNIIEINKIDTAHYFPLKNESWPVTIIDIQGPQF